MKKPPSLRPYVPQPRCPQCNTCSWQPHVYREPTCRGCGADLPTRAVYAITAPLAEVFATALALKQDYEATHPDTRKEL